MARKAKVIMHSCLIRNGMPGIFRAAVNAMRLPVGRLQPADGRPGVPEQLRLQPEHGRHAPRQLHCGVLGQDAQIHRPDVWQLLPELLLLRHPHREGLHLCVRPLAFASVAVHVVGELDCHILICTLHLSAVVPSESYRISGKSNIGLPFTRCYMH